jgi:hypothetical protein
MDANFLDETFTYEQAEFDRAQLELADWLKNKSENRKLGMIIEYLVIKHFQDQKTDTIESIDERIEHIRGQGDFKIGGLSVDIKNSTYTKSNSISFPKTDQVQFYNDKLFLLCELDLKKKQIIIWGYCDWEFAQTCEINGNYVLVKKHHIEKFLA